MAALGALVKKAWSVRRYLVLVSAPLALVPILLSLPPKVPAPGHRRGGVGGAPLEAWMESSGRGARAHAPAGAATQGMPWGMEQGTPAGSTGQEQGLGGTNWGHQVWP